MVKSHYLYFLKHNLSARLLGKKRPLLAGFKITYRCNLKCRTCPFWKKDEIDIPYEKAIAVMDEFHKLGVRLLIFEGGEPFIWREKKHRFEDLVNYAKKRFYRVGVTTNGMLPLDSSADVLWVSLDGLKKSHDLNRGKSFDTIIENVVKSSHSKILANITITSLNHHEIDDAVKFLNPLVKGITIQFYYPFPNSEDLSLPVKDRINVLDKIIYLKRKGYKILDSVRALQDLKYNSWRCHDWLIANAEPNGKMNVGCYLKGRAAIGCENCGFAAHTEISLAYDWRAGAILSGKKVFDFKILDF
ncbi:hypothetical protein B6I21_00630 [candidate division KSB1 bacterium 4572_119]|nr:MAG: hypothetical protein B6I21_00630 [candidate division KSB1 bacterium 4572_119]